MKLYLLICTNENHEIAGVIRPFPDCAAAAKAMDAEVRKTIEMLTKEGMGGISSKTESSRAYVEYGSEYSYNWSVNPVELSADLPVDAKLSIAKDLVDSIPGSQYWPSRSPAPCSTEREVMEAIKQSSDKLDRAITFHRCLYGRKRYSENDIPATVITEL